MRRTRTRQYQHLASLDLFAGCTTRQIETIERLGTEVVVSAGTPVWQEGNTDAQVVVVIDGQIDLTHAGEPIGTLHCGTWFGHNALLNGQRSEVLSGTASAPTRLVAFSKREFVSLLDAAPAVSATLRAASTARATSTQHHDPVVESETTSVPLAPQRGIRRNPISAPVLTAGGIR